MNQTEEFSTGKLFPMIVRYSVPAAISLLITAIYNIVDRIFVGNFCGTSALAGLSVCFPLSFLMMAVALTCSAGGASLFSLFHGSGQTEDMSRSFGNSYLMVVVFELILSALLLLFADPILHLFGVTETCYSYALEYYRIVALGCIFQGISQVCCDFVRVSGKPVLGMCVTGIGAVTNIILDFLFVVVFDMRVQGAAVATVIGQFCSAAFGSVQVFSGKTLVKVSADIFRIRTGLAGRIISCGFSFFIAQVAMGLISLVYNGQLGKYGGDTAISVYAVQRHDFCDHACQRYQPRDSADPRIRHACHNIFPIHWKTYAVDRRHCISSDHFSDLVYLYSSAIPGNERNLLGAADQ